MTLGKFLRTGAAALGALAVASVTQANAADMYAGSYKEAPVYIPPPLWTGFYIGGHLGAAWETLSFQRHEFDDFGPCSASCGGWSYAPGFFDANRNSGADAFGGVQFGYNFQSPSSFVYGIEVDLGGMSLSSKSRSHANTTWAHSSDGGKTYDYIGGTTGVLDGDAQGGFYGDVTGRLGWTWGPALIYAKGGFAWLNADLRKKESVFDSYGTFCSSGVGWCDFNHNNNNTLTGWTVGGGVEWKVSPAWSIKVEYLHFDFSNFNNNCCNDPMYQAALAAGYSYNNLNNHSDLQVDTVKLGFNYFWNPAPPAPLK